MLIDFLLTSIMESTYLKFEQYQVRDENSFNATRFESLWQSETPLFASAYIAFPNKKCRERPTNLPNTTTASKQPMTIPAIAPPDNTPDGSGGKQKRAKFTRSPE